MGNGRIIRSKVLDLHLPQWKTMATDEIPKFLVPSSGEVPHQSREYRPQGKVRLVLLEIEYALHQLFQSQPTEPIRCGDPLEI